VRRLWRLVRAWWFWFRRDHHERRLAQAEKLAEEKILQAQTYNFPPEDRWVYNLTAADRQLEHEFAMLTSSVADRERREKEKAAQQNYINTLGQLATTQPSFMSCVGCQTGGCPVGGCRFMSQQLQRELLLMAQQRAAQQQLQVQAARFSQMMGMAQQQAPQPDWCPGCPTVCSPGRCMMRGQT